MVGGQKEVVPLVLKILQTCIVVPKFLRQLWKMPSFPYLMGLFYDFAKSLAVFYILLITDFFLFMLKNSSRFPFWEIECNLYFVNILPESHGWMEV